MPTIYACTWAEKVVRKDDYEHGCDDNGTWVLAEKQNIVADSLTKLIEAIGNQFGLKIDDIFLDEDDGLVDYIGFNRMEDADGCEPTPGMEFDWKIGNKELWLADYTFGVEKREVSSISAAEFAPAGITTH